jgi:arabinose-5-phosphate isomerase
VTDASRGESLDLVGIGSMVVDRVHRAPRALRADEKGILREIEGSPLQRMTGGVLLNQLGWAAALGLRTGICGRQGRDEHGRFLRAAMDRAGIQRDLELCDGASSFAEIFVDDASGRAIYMAPGITSTTTAQHVREHHAAFIRRASRFSTEVSQLPLEAALEALRLAREVGIPTVVDLDVPPSDALASGLGDEATLWRVLESADLLKPSKSAARELAARTGSDTGEMARLLRARFGCQAVVVTDGEAGCAISSEQFTGFVPGRRVKALDTTGAGDAFLGGLLVALHHGFRWEDAGRLANACGAACVERLGAFPEDLPGARARVLELYEGPSFTLTPLPASASQQRASDEAREALGVLDVAVEELAALCARLDPQSFERAIELVRASEARGGRVHVTGVGKPGHVAHYAASLLASTGTPATFLHATEAIHGSAGQLVAGDVVIAISNSGETQELRHTIEASRAMGAAIIGVTGAPRSWLAAKSDVWLDAGVAREGGPLGLAPRASVAAEVLVLAALAAGLERGRGFDHAEYHRRHPAGALGKLAREGKK